MKQLIILILCLGSMDANAQSKDSSLTLLHYWKDSLLLDKKGIKLINEYNGCVNETRRCISACNYFIKEAKWLIEHDEKIRAVESIHKADLSNKRAEKYEKKSTYYLELIKRRKQKYNERN